MKPIKEKMRKTGGNYIFHDTKEDVRILMDYCNMLADKINELNDEVQTLKSTIEAQKTVLDELDKVEEKEKEKEENTSRQVMYQDSDGNYRYRGFWSGFGDQ